MRQVVNDSFSVSNGQSSETIVIDDPNSLTDVETYYQSALNTKGWTVQAADPSQAVSGDGWQFGLTGSSAQFAITFVTMGAITEITVQYETSGPGSSQTPTTQRVDSSVTSLMLTAGEASVAVKGALPVSEFHRCRAWRTGRNRPAHVSRSRRLGEVRYCVVCREQPWSRRR